MKTAIAINLMLIALVTGHDGAAEDDLARFVFSGTGFTKLEHTGVDEPSGLVFHPDRGTLFVVGDGGDLAELTTDGALVRSRRLGARDLEGITCDPSSGLLYLAVEGEERILELDLESLAIRREFQIERVFAGATVLGEGGQGLEGITFVPDPKHAEGGTFLVANQCFTSDNAEDPSAIFEVEAPVRSGPASGVLPAKIVRRLDLAMTDLSGLHWDATRGRLDVISDSNNILLETSYSGTEARVWACPGKDQEGVAMDTEGRIYFAQDSGGIIRFSWRPPQASAERSAP